jgi:glyoxylase-like metal-dependent hydrolase (beta-lactamase superfamily II)
MMGCGSRFPNFFIDSNMTTPDLPICHAGGFTATNGFLIEGPQGWIAVDAPADFLEFISRQNIRLGALLLTHSHFDHVVDAAALAQEHGCPVYAWMVSTPESRLESWLSQMAGMNFGIKDYPVDVLVRDGDTLTVCGLEMHCSHVPGHSEDSVSFYFPERNIVFSGDTLMQETMGRTDFPGGGMAMLLNSIKTKILTLPDHTLVCPGHGECTAVGAERPWVLDLARQYED